MTQRRQFRRVYTKTIQYKLSAKACKNQLKFLPGHGVAVVAAQTFARISNDGIFVVAIFDFDHLR